MIKKINKLKNFGTYLDFISDNKNNINPYQDFNKYNFFYGWNYSGKTTLSRLFRFIEQKKLNSDFQNIEFEISLSDGNKITHKNLEKNNLKIRVFNEDYVNDNFRWNDENHKISPVLILGEENIKLQEELKQKEEEFEKRKEGKEKVEKDKKTLEINFDRNLQNEASSIRNILGITNPKEFDKIALKNKIDELKRKLDIYRNQRTYEQITLVNIENNIESLIMQTNQILTQKISPQQIIEKLKNNPELNEWVRKGIDLHKKEKKQIVNSVEILCPMVFLSV